MKKVLRVSAIILLTLSFIGLTTYEILTTGTFSGLSFTPILIGICWFGFGTIIMDIVKDFKALKESEGEYEDE